MQATVDRVITGEDGLYAGVQARFLALDDLARDRFGVFVDRGDPDPRPPEDAPDEGSLEPSPSLRGEALT